MKSKDKKYFFTFYVSNTKHFWNKLIKIDFKTPSIIE